MKPTTEIRRSAVHAGRQAAGATLSAVLLIAFAASVAAFPAPAQTQHATPASLGAPAQTLHLGPSERDQLEAALRAMSVHDLRLTFARIHATFRAHIGDDDLRLARALIDCAFLTQAELARRGHGHPESTESAGEMLRLFELLL